MKPSKALTIGLGCLALGLATSYAEEATSSRMWTDKQGRQVKATFVGLDGDKISIQTDAGQIFTFALSNLSAEDQNIAKTLKPAATYIAVNATIGQAAMAIDAAVKKGLDRGAATIQKNNAAIMADVSLSDERKKADMRVVPAANKLMSDEQFARRVYLDIVGRIPSHDEVSTFLADSSKSKRAELIDTLLNSPGYNSHAYNYFAEMLRVKDDLEQDNLRGTPYINWLQTQIETNRPWNEMVSEMLTADGKMWHNGAAGYLLRDAGMPLDNLANTMAIFLGTDVACAQCHDHPFADWTQHQFYEMAAFFGATTTDIRTAQRRKTREKGAMAMNAAMDVRNKLMPEIEKMIEAGGGDIRRERNGLENFIGANQWSISDSQTNTLKLPFDYKYKDAKPNDPVAPKLITWSKSDTASGAYKSSKSKKEENLRATFANWLTHPENPRFAMSIANRMWKRAFGVAVSEPVTNIDDPEKASNPELLKHLAKEMIRLKFNLKEFMRIVYNTQTYQREATIEEVPMGEPYYFQGPLLRRLTAEQAWDSYMTMVLGNPDAYKKPLEDLYGRSIDLDLTSEKLDAKTVLMKYAAYRKMGEKERELTGGGLEMAGKDMMAEKMEGAAPAASMMEGKSLSFGGMTLRRAAELEQPARGGHFLTEFGQSQRTLIDGGSKAGSVPQVLMMMNGNGQQMLTSPSSLLFRTMEKATEPAGKVESVFLSVLGRRPTATEQEIAKRNIDAAGPDAYSNLIWALINTREFIFVQ
jgi:hypothetical protein